MNQNQVIYLRNNLRGLSNEGNDYCKAVVNEAPSLRGISAVVTTQLLTILCVQVGICLALTGILFLFQPSNPTSNGHSIWFGLIILPYIHFIFSNLSKWNGWETFVEEVNNNSYRFNLVIEAAGDSHSSSIRAKSLVVIITCSIIILKSTLLFSQFMLFIWIAVLVAFAISSYLNALAVVRSAFMVLVSNDLKQYQHSVRD